MLILQSGCYKLVINKRFDPDIKLYKHERQRESSAAVFRRFYTASDGGVLLLPSRPMPYPSPWSTPDASSCEFDRRKPCSLIYGCCCCTAAAALSAGCAVATSIGCTELACCDSLLAAEADFFCSCSDAVSADGLTGHSKWTQWNTCNRHTQLSNNWNNLPTLNPFNAEPVARQVLIKVQLPQK